MGNLSQPASSAIITGTVSPADETGTDLFYDLDVPIAQLGLGDQLEFGISGRINSFNYTTNTWTWNLFFTDALYSALTAPASAGTVADVIFMLRGVFTRIAGTGTNIRLVGTIEQRFDAAVLDRVLATDSEVGLSVADILSVTIATAAAVTVVNRTSYIRILKS